VKKRDKRVLEAQLQAKKEEEEKLKKEQELKKEKEERHKQLRMQSFAERLPQLEELKLEDFDIPEKKRNLKMINNCIALSVKRILDQKTNGTIMSDQNRTNKKLQSSN